MKKRIWKRYIYLIIVGLAVYIGERKDTPKIGFYVGKELVQAFVVENEQNITQGMSLDLTQKMLEENQRVLGGTKQEEKESEEKEPLGLQELARQEKHISEKMVDEESTDIVPQLIQVERGFAPHEKQVDYDWEALKEYKNLIATFYAIDASTATSASQLNLEVLTSKDMTINRDLGPYQILIYHSHSQEAFVDSKAGVQEDTIVGMGAYLSKVLSEKYGYGVLHHTAEYDTFRDDAYAVALPEMEKLLAENPSIQVVIDLHRDAGVKGVKRVVEMDGKECATFMLFNGLSYNRKTGSIKYLENPNLADNLAFSFQVQVKAGQYYPGLTRKIYLKGYRYNMHLKPQTLLIELGDSNNTVEQARNTLEPLAHILHMVLSGE